MLCVHESPFTFLLELIKLDLRTSLRVQKLRIHLPMQGTWVWSLVWGDCISPCATTTEAVPATMEARVLQLAKTHKQQHSPSAAAAAAKSLQSCLTVRPHRRQPTRLPRPWDSPGKNTGVGCHFLLQCMKVKVKLPSRVWLFSTPWTAAYQAPPSMGFSRHEYWSGVPSPSPRPSAATNKWVNKMYF